MSQIFDEIKERCDKKIVEMLNIPSEQLMFGNGSYSGVVRYPRG